MVCVCCRGDIGKVLPCRRFQPGDHNRESHGCLYLHVGISILRFSVAVQAARVIGEAMPDSMALVRRAMAITESAVRQADADI